MTAKLKQSSTSFSPSISKTWHQLVTLSDVERLRHRRSRRMSGHQLNIGEQFGDDDELYCFLRHYGFKWSNTVKKNKFAKPTLVEIIDGLKRIVEKKVKEDLKHSPKKEIELYVRQYHQVFDKLLEGAEIQNGGKNEQYTDPESKTVRLILWLFTIEPSFYADLNDACINEDEEMLELLGPFARAIHLILKYVELNRENKIPFGMEFDLSGDPLGAFSQCFLLFRGTSMRREHVSTWQD